MVPSIDIYLNMPASPERETADVLALARTLRGERRGLFLPLGDTMTIRESAPHAPHKGLLGPQCRNALFEPNAFKLKFRLPFTQQNLPAGQLKAALAHWESCFQPGSPQRRQAGVNCFSLR